MIRLYSRNCLVTAADGTVRSLDGDALRHDLRRAFRSCGIAEDDSADHIALVIEEHVASRLDPNLPPIPEQDLQAMVLALLPAAGFRDVGQAYAALLPEAAQPVDPDPFQSWDRNRVEAELADRLPLADAERTAIVAQTAAALATLGLTQARAELIHSLARHFLQQRALAGTAPAPGSPWCLPPGAWPLTAVPGAAALTQTGILRTLPVSRFLPRLRLELDLRRLADANGPPPLFEMVFLPALARALDCTAALFAEARRAVQAALAAAAPCLPAHLLVYGLDDCLENALLPQSPRARKALCHDLHAIAEAKLRGAGLGPVLLTFRQPRERPSP